MRARGIAAVAAAWIVAGAFAAQAGAADVPPYRAGDYAGGGFHDVLPPGTNGLANGPQLLAFLTTGRRPEHNDDQLGMYADLVRATPGLTGADLPKYFKDSSFGVRPDDVARTYSPRSDVTIVRDKSFGVPHVYGTTRAGTMFGLGYAAAEDRLFFIDVLRHLGRAQLSSFAGGAPGNRAFDQEQWSIAPYTEVDLQRQADQFPILYGQEGREVADDVTAYVAGINRYIDEAKLDPTKMPGEYAALGRPLGPDPWKVTDVIATASLVGGIFGKGGGQELPMAQFLQALQQRFGNRTGRRLWYQLAAFDDPDAPTTVKRERFPYQRPPKRPAKGAEVLPDPGSLKYEPVVVAGTDAQGSGGSGSGGGAPGGGLPQLPVPLPLPKAQSNALVISAEKSRSGRPLAVFGPQTGYFAPQILMEQDVHGPGIDARGASFPGVNLYVELGHGGDYAWSATSAGQDIIDTFALPACNGDQGYMYKNECLPFEVLERTNSWTPNAADQTPPGSQTLRTLRTKLGLVTGRGTVKGRPVVFTALRSTYMHEVDSARGFKDFNDPSKIRNARDFQRAAYKIGYTFNWLYVDDKDVAYFNSGNNPVRRKGTTGQLPMAPRNVWAGFDPSDVTARYTPFAQHPQVIDQDWITSWNNKQAKGYAGADSNLFSSVFRSNMLDQEIRARLKGGRRLTLPGLVDAMEEAGTTDLRGEKVLPLALRVIGTPKDPKLAAAVDTLRAWVRSGAHRRDKDGDGRYDDADAVRIMDAWWPRWMRVQFLPVLGPAAFDAIPHEMDNAPNNHGDHLGSAYQTGWYGYAYKDLRRVLGLEVRQRYARAFCGHGRLGQCRARLRASLAEALAVPATEIYKGDPLCQDGDQGCYDAIRFRPLGGVTQPLIPWVNRPTYQQAVEIAGHRPR
jgi:acyl-homoserine lactone acylase PvdQ